MQFNFGIIVLQTILSGSILRYEKGKALLVTSHVELV